MAENTIDNLSIQVVASAERAISTFNRLASGASGLRGAARGAAGGMQDMAQGARDAGTATQQAGTQSGKARPNIKGVGKDAKDAGDKAKKGASGLATFWQSLKRIAYYRMIRGIIKGIGDALNYGITNLYQWSSAVNGRFASSMDTIKTATNYLKNSFAAMVSPLVNALAPALDFIIDRVVDVINWFNQLFAVLSGASTYTVAKKVASTWADAGNSAAGSAKKAADDIKRTILGFDEINKLVDNNNKGTGSGSGSSNPGNAGSVLFEEKPLTGGFAGFSNAIENALSDTLSRIGLIVSGASLAVGAILAFGGANVPLGLSLMAAGAAGLVSIVGINWDGLSADVKLAIGAVEVAVGGALLGLGAVLAFSGGHLGLGIAMMAAGAATLAAAVGLNWDLLSGKVSVSVEGVVRAVSAASLALGAILAFTGVNVPLGVGLIAAGVTGVAATVNWDYLKDKLQSTIGGATLIISSASLLLGILALAGGMVPLGIGLIVAGAGGLATTVAANWDNFVDIGKMAIKKVKDGWETIKQLAVTAVVSLAKNVAEWASDVWDWLQVTGGTIAKVVEASFKAVGKWAGDAWDAVKTGAGAIGKAVEATFTAISGWTGDAWDVVKAGAGTIGKVVTATFNALGNWIGDAWNAVKAGAETIGKVVTATFSAIGGWIGDAWNTVKAGAETIGKVVTATFSAIGGWVGDAWNTVKAGAQTIGKTVTATFSAISGWISPAWDTVKAGAQTIAKKVEAAFAETTGWLSDAWKFINGDANVLKNIIVSFLPDLDSMPDWMAKLIGISPNQKKAADTILKTALDVVFNGKAGKGVESVNEENIELCGVSPSTVTVNGTPGNGFTGKLSGTNKYTLNGINDASVNVDMQQSWLGTPKEALGFSDLTNKAQEVKVALKKVAEWQTNGIGKYLDITTQTPKVNVDLKKKWGKKTPVDYLGLSGLSTTIKVGLRSDGSKLKVRVSKGTATIQSATKRTENVEQTKALGGVFSNGRWSNIPQYANGTLNAGTIFAAGEAGPEIVGHVGGRTEVLNKSQLASAMFSAVQAAMAPAAANFASAAQSMGVANVSFDFETLAEMIRQGVEQAMARSNDYDRQKVALLQQINEKDYNPEISTSSINKAQQRMNRRAGTTIVPIGT